MVCYHERVNETKMGKYFFSSFFSFPKALIVASTSLPTANDFLSDPSQEHYKVLESIFMLWERELFLHLGHFIIPL